MRNKDSSISPSQVTPEKQKNEVSSLRRNRSVFSLKKGRSCKESTTGSTGSSHTRDSHPTSSVHPEPIKSTSSSRGDNPMDVAISTSGNIKVDIVHKKDRRSRNNTFSTQKSHRRAFSTGTFATVLKTRSVDRPQERQLVSRFSNDGSSDEGVGTSPLRTRIRRVGSKDSVSSGSPDGMRAPRLRRFLRRYHQDSATSRILQEVNIQKIGKASPTSEGTEISSKPMKAPINPTTDVTRNGASGDKQIPENCIRPSNDAITIESNKEYRIGKNATMEKCSEDVPTPRRHHHNPNQLTLPRYMSIGDVIRDISNSSLSDSSMQSKSPTRSPSSQKASIRAATVATHITKKVLRPTQHVYQSHYKGGINPQLRQRNLYMSSFRNQKTRATYKSQVIRVLTSAFPLVVVLLALVMPMQEIPVSTNAALTQDPDSGTMGNNLGESSLQEDSLSHVATPSLATQTSDPLQLGLVRGGAVRGQYVGSRFDAKDLYDAYKEIQSEYYEKAFTAMNAESTGAANAGKNGNKWKVLAKSNAPEEEGGPVEIAMMEHPSDPSTPYIRMSAVMPASVEKCWDFLRLSNWDKSMPKMDPFYEGVTLFGEYTHYPSVLSRVRSGPAWPHMTSATSDIRLDNPRSSFFSRRIIHRQDQSIEQSQSDVEKGDHKHGSGVHMIVARKRTQRILAFGKRDFAFVSVSDLPLEDGTWVSGTVSIETRLIPRQEGYTRAFQDSIAFYKPLPPPDVNDEKKSRRERTRVTIVCRINLNDIGESGDQAESNGWFPMWLYVKTIGVTGARSVLNMRQALLEEQQIEEKEQRQQQSRTVSTVQENLTLSKSSWSLFPRTKSALNDETASRIGRRSEEERAQEEGLPFWRQRFNIHKQPESH